MLVGLFRPLYRRGSFQIPPFLLLTFGALMAPDVKSRPGFPQFLRSRSLSYSVFASSILVAGSLPLLELVLQFICFLLLKQMPSLLHLLGFSSSVGKTLPPEAIIFPGSTRKTAGNSPPTMMKLSGHLLTEIWASHRILPKMTVDCGTLSIFRITSFIDARWRDGWTV